MGDKRNEFADHAVIGVADVGELGEVIRSRRQELGYTQEHFSSVMGMSPRLICEIEHGKKTTGIQKIMDIITMLNIECVLTMRDRW